MKGKSMKEVFKECFGVEFEEFILPKNKWKNPLKPRDIIDDSTEIRR